MANRVDDAAKEVLSRLDDIRNRTATKTVLSETTGTEVPTKENADSKDVALKGTGEEYERKIVWFPNVFGFAALHLMGLYGLYLSFHSPLTFVYMYTLALFTNIVGMNLGAHRLYTHRAFKVTLPLRILVNICNTIVGQNCLWVWVRDHRLHHKYSDTDGDPHNATRGFFFSHVGWLMMRKHPEVISKGRTIDMTDMMQDGLIMWQKKYYWPMYFVLGLVLPMAIPMVFWGETLKNSFFITYCFRMIIQLNYAWAVNSVAHAWGTKPYDKNIAPVESLLASILANGEGWHNYHHAFPWDYKASEYGFWNPTTFFIDTFAKMGWAYDLKVASNDVITARAIRAGDGSYSPKVPGGEKAAQ